MKQINHSCMIISTSGQIELCHKARKPTFGIFFLSWMAVISNRAPPWEFGPYFIYRSHFSFDFGVPCNWSVIFITGSLASSLLCQLKCPSNEWDKNFEEARTGMGQLWSGPGPGFFIQFAIGQDWSNSAGTGSWALFCYKIYHSQLWLDAVRLIWSNLQNYLYMGKLGK